MTFQIIGPPPTYPGATSLKKTCRKLGVSFWSFLKDRVGAEGVIAPLPALIELRAQSP
jgi:hypothetical protein